MKYFVRKTEDSQIEGPLSVEKINQMVAEGRLTADTLATSDLGEGRERIAKSPKRDWFKLGHIRGVRGVPEILATEASSPCMNESGGTNLVKAIFSTICSFIFGIITGGGLAAATPFIMLGEFEGHIHLAFPLGFVLALGLGLAAIVSRPVGTPVGVSCGIAFSLPVVIACYLIRGDERTLRWHGGELIFVAVLAVASSLAVMIMVGESRKPIMQGGGAK